jgi:hypothetical protein
MRKSTDIKGYDRKEKGVKVGKPSRCVHVGMASFISKGERGANTDAIVTTDQSPDGAIRRAYHHLGDEAEEMLKGRFRIVKFVSLSNPFLLVIFLSG